MVRVDEQCPLQLVRRPGELAQDEDAVVIEAAGDILLGDQVHPIPQSGDQHDVRREVERHHLVARVAAVVIADRRVADRAEVPVDAPDGELDVIAERHVGLHPLPAGVGHLHEGDVLDVQSALGQKLAVCLQPMGDALGVVEAVDAEHDRRGVAEIFTDLARPGLNLRIPRKRLEALGVDRDGELPGHDRPGRPRSADRAVGPDAGRRVDQRHIDQRAPRDVALQPTHCASEVADIGDALEADHIGPEQPLDNLSAPRQLRVNAVWRKRNVIEESDREIWPELAKQLGHQLQLVVVHPDHGIRRTGLCGCLGEPPVDAQIGLPPIALERWRRDHVVVERPQGVIGETLVVVLDLALAQRDRNDPDAVAVERLEDEVGLAGPADPGAAVGAHDRLQGGDQATGRMLPLRIPVRVDHPVHREAIGDDDE